MSLGNSLLNSSDCWLIGCMKPSVWVRIDPDDEILKDDHVSQRVGNYLPGSRWRKRYRPTDCRSSNSGGDQLW